MKLTPEQIEEYLNEVIEVHENKYKQEFLDGEIEIGRMEKIRYETLMSVKIAIFGEDD